MEKKIQNINQEQHAILVGILLGDAHLELSNNKKAARLRITQSSEHESYVEHLYERFNGSSLSSIRNRNRAGRIVYEFDSSYTSSLLPCHKLFYNKDKKKIIPIEWLHFEFTSRSLTYLCMDDGGLKSKDSKGVFINTYEYPELEQQKFCDILNKNLGLKATLAKDRGNFRIFLSGDSFETFLYLFNPYFIEGFQNKLPSPRKSEGRKKPIAYAAIERRREEDKIDLKRSIDFNSMLSFSGLIG